MVTWGRIPLPSAQQNRMDSLPPAAAPWRGLLPRCARRESALPWWGPGAGCRMRASLGSAPAKGPGAAGMIVQASLKRGLSPPPGGDWGFLVSRRGREERRGKKPSVTASPCHLPFQGRFLAGGQCPPLRRSAAGSSRPTDGEQHPKAMPPNRWRAAPRLPGYRSNAEVFDPQPQPSSERREPPLPTPPLRPVASAKAGAPRGGRRS